MAGNVQSHCIQTSYPFVTWCSPPLLSQAIIRALGAVLQCDEETLHGALEELAGAIEAMSEALRRMHGESSWCLCLLQLITHIGVTAQHL